MATSLQADIDDLIVRIKERVLSYVDDDDDVWNLDEGGAYLDNDAPSTPYSGHSPRPARSDPSLNKHPAKAMKDVMRDVQAKTLKFVALGDNWVGKEKVKTPKPLAIYLACDILGPTLDEVNDAKDTLSRHLAAQRQRQLQ